MTRPLDRVGILRGEPRREHAAHRVADRHDLVDPLVLEDELRVARLRVEVVGRDRLRRFAVPDLVRDDDAKSGVGQPVDDVTEVEAAESCCRCISRTTWPLAVLVGAMSI